MSSCIKSCINVRWPPSIISNASEHADTVYAGKFYNYNCKIIRVTSYKKKFISEHYCAVMAGIENASRKSFPGSFISTDSTFNNLHLHNHLALQGNTKSEMS